MSQTSNSETQTKILAILQQLSPEEKKLLSEVIQAEKERIHMKLPRGIYEDLHSAIERVIK